MVVTATISDMIAETEDRIKKKCKVESLELEWLLGEIERLRAEVERLRNGLTAILHQANREDTESDYKIDMMRHLAQRILDGVTIHPMSPLLHAPGSQPSKEGVSMSDKRVDRCRSIEPENRYWWQQTIVDQADEIERLRAEDVEERAPSPEADEHSNYGLM